MFRFAGMMQKVIKIDPCRFGRRSRRTTRFERIDDATQDFADLLNLVEALKTLVYKRRYDSCLPLDDCTVEPFQKTPLSGK